jgi:hypothetical protein
MRGRYGAPISEWQIPGHKTPGPTASKCFWNEFQSGGGNAILSDAFFFCILLTVFMKERSDGVLLTVPTKLTEVSKLKLLASSRCFRRNC